MRDNLSTVVNALCLRHPRDDWQLVATSILSNLADESRDWDVIANGIVSHRCLSIALEHIRSHADGSRISARLEPKINSRMESHFEATGSEPDILRKLPSNLCDTVAIIKGYALKQLYDGMYTRDFADIDLYLSDEKSFWELMTLTSEDYEFDRIKRIRYSSGLVAYTTDLRPKQASRTYPPIDIHACTYPMWGGMSFTPSSRRVPSSSTLGHFLSWEDTLIMIAAHSTTEWMYRCRDINDITLLLLKHGEHLDWSYIETTTMELGLSELLNSLIRRSIQSSSSAVRSSILKTIPSSMGRKSRIGIPEALFLRFGYSRHAKLSALPIQTKLSARHYRRHAGIIQTTATSVYHGANLMFHGNRAFGSGKAKHTMLSIPLLTKLDVLVPFEIGNHEIQISGDENLNGGDTKPSASVFVSPIGPLLISKYDGTISNDFVACVDNG